MWQIGARSKALCVVTLVVNVYAMASQPPRLLPEFLAKMEASWKCQACTLVNTRAARCQACNARRPAAPTIGKAAEATEAAAASLAPRRSRPPDRFVAAPAPSPAVAHAYRALLSPPPGAGAARGDGGGRGAAPRGGKGAGAGSASDLPGRKRAQHDDPDACPHCWRHGFTGRRNMIGCYLTTDDWQSNLRVLERRVAEGREAEELEETRGVATAG